MIPDEIQRTIEFLLKHQADAAIRIEDSDRRLQKLNESTNRQFEETNRQIQETNRKVQELTESTNRFQQEMKGFINILVPLLEIQSKRMDRFEGLS